MFEALGAPTDEYISMIRNKTYRKSVIALKGKHNDSGETAIDWFQEAFPPNVADFLFRCLTWDPVDRSNVQDLLQHKYLTEGQDDESKDQYEVDEVTDRMYLEFNNEFKFEMEDYSTWEYRAELRKEMNYGDGRCDTYI